MDSLSVDFYQDLNVNYGHKFYFTIESVAIQNAWEVDNVWDFGKCRRNKQTTHKEKQFHFIIIIIIDVQSGHNYGGFSRAIKMHQHKNDKEMDETVENTFN